MFIRTLSDLHNECEMYEIPHLDTDKDTTLSLAGDIYDRKRLMPWLESICGRFKHIVVVLGNHDYWNGSYELVQAHHKQYLIDNKMSNVHLLFESAIELDGVSFFGGTLWTDFNNNDPLTKISCNMMVDYKKIRTNHHTRRWTTIYAQVQHNDFLLKLKAHLNAESSTGKPIVVVSHHAPCALSLDPRYLHQHIANGFYASDLSNLILDNPQIRLWHHGHVHSYSNYMLGTTQIICNPCGYNHMDHIEGHDALLTIEVTESVGNY